MDILGPPSVCGEFDTNTRANAGQYRSLDYLLVSRVAGHVPRCCEGDSTRPVCGCTRARESCESNTSPHVNCSTGYMKMLPPDSCVAWCVWTAFATLAGIGIIRPVKMLPIVLLEIFYKVLWLILVAYPLWSKGTLAGSPAEGITSEFLWVILPIVAVPWSYVFVTYIYKSKEVEKKGDIT